MKEKCIKFVYPVIAGLVQMTEDPIETEKGGREQVYFQ